MTDLQTTSMALVVAVFSCMRACASAPLTRFPVSVRDVRAAHHRNGGEPGEIAKVVVGNVISFGATKGNYASGDAGITWGPANRSGDAAPGFRAGAVLVTLWHSFHAITGSALIVNSNAH